jgi:hypothetical protein
MADNFDMKKFLVENKLGAYSRLKENEEQLNEYEVTYEYGSDGSCYRVDDEGNYDEVDDSYCRRYAGQGVREEKGEAALNESALELLTVLSGVAGLGLSSLGIAKWQEKLEREYPELHKQLQSISKTISTADPSKNLEEDADTQAEKDMDFLAEEEPLKESALELLTVLSGVAGLGLSSLGIAKWQEKLERDYPELHKQLQNISKTISTADPSKNLEENKDASGIENDIEQDLMYTEDPILYLKSIIDFCNKKIEEIGQDTDGIEEAKKEEGYMGTQYDSSEDMAVDMIKKGITEKSKEELKEFDEPLMQLINDPETLKTFLASVAKLGSIGFGIAGLIKAYTKYIASKLKKDPKFADKSSEELEKMAGQALTGKVQASAGGTGGGFLAEALTPEMFERMDAVTSTRAQLAMIKAAEIMMNELTEEGFEVLDIREYFTQLIANDI